MEEIVQNKIVADPQNIPGEEKKENLVTIDFKMITFSLAGKDYAVDIMNVKEIAKGGHFTYVPNTAPFVLGVYNLRGDIIPIIDLRLFFNIDITRKKTNEIENMIILTVEDKVFGIIVDAIDKVVGIQKSTIQPPHPLFGDINIKYIYGVVESNGRLYVLLDVDRIFTNKPRESINDELEQAAINNLNASHMMKQSMEGKNINEILKNAAGVKAALSESPVDKTESVAKKPAAESPKVEEKPVNIDFKFIAEGLASNNKFYVSDINSDWVEKRLDSWAKERKNATTQITNETDGLAFLKGFASPCSDSFWTKEYADAVYAALPDNSAKQIIVWNPGCGKGYESYSLACIMKKRYPEAKIKVFAQDMDLLNVSNASLLSVPENVANSWYGPYVVKNVSGGYSFSQDIKDVILFEYHDCSHTNTIPSPDVIFCRDMLSISSEDAQNTILTDFEEKLKGNGILIIGENETLSGKMNWTEKLVGNICVYSK
ncbi:MAG: chemotaxis protein CheW [Treponema sp.]|nr:chemotaxis protein CheW [Treponema sp.]